MTPRLAALAVVLALVACARDDRPVPVLPPPAATAPNAAPAAPAPPATAADLRAAESALAAYLDASRDGSATAAARDTLLGCDGGRAFVLPITILGAYRVLPASGAGDTLLGRAAVVTVAEQRFDRRNAGRYTARQRVEVDTLEWDLVRRPGGGWWVCNGLQFGFHGPDERTTWAPSGASRASARRAADSVGAAWRDAP